MKLILLGFYFICSSGYGQEFAKWDAEKLILDNGFITKEIFIGDRNLKAEILKLNWQHQNFLNQDSKEFSLQINGKELNGTTDWSEVSCTKAVDQLEGNGATITLKYGDFDVQVTYLLYPCLPLIRKRISIVNHSNEDIAVEALNIEDMNTSFDPTFSWIMTDYGRRMKIGSYTGDAQDCIITLHNIRKHMGIVLGNEAPGVTKHTSVFRNGGNVICGLTPPDHVYPFRAWVEPDERWNSPWVFTALYAGTDDPMEVLNSTISDFTRKHMGIRLMKTKYKPALVYNNWYPFRSDISEVLMKELADATAECGVEEFIVDAGWYSLKDTSQKLDWSESCGDYIVNPDKFPNGLTPVFKYAEKQGMRPGLWISLAMASVQSQVYQDHPEWFVVGKDGKHTCLHNTWQTHDKTACMGTDWYDHIKSVISEQTRKYNLSYTKLDLSIVTSAYVSDPAHTGCYSTEHPYHKDRNESFLVLYERAWQLFDELHEEFPNLYIDCTFETMGGIQLIDFDMCKHAEGNWLSNIYSTGVTGALRARQLAWWRSPAIPASALVLGNLRLDDPYRELYLKSLAGAFPIMLGDPRKLSEKERAGMKLLVTWLKKCQEKHDYMMFRQDLAGFGEPGEGHWDGYQRINTDTKSGGIVGVFRHGAIETHRQVFVKYLDTAKEYLVREGPKGNKIARLTGKELAEEGFAVTLKKVYDGVVYEICLQ